LHDYAQGKQQMAVQLAGGKGGSQITFLWLLWAGSV
jgi:hypothetical protein